MNIQDAARYSGKSEKTLRRWIRDAVLPAVTIQGRYDIKMSDLDAVCTVLPTQDTLSDRIRDLERRVSDLEAILAQMSNNNAPTARKPAPRLPQKHERASINPLPDGWASIADLINEHDLPRSTVMRQMGKYIHTGEWTRAGHAVSKALDPEGIAEFEKRYVRE